MIGRKRRWQASRMAASGSAPLCRWALTAKSTIMMPFFFTRPISSSTPTSAITDRS